MFSSSIRGGLLARRLISSSPFCTSSLPPKAPTIHKILDFHVQYPPELEGVFSLATANQEEITKHKISLAVAKHRKHRSDTGSAAVQLAVMTETIYNQARHFAMHKKDKAGHRSFQMLLSRRRKMMKYLREKNFEEYRAVVIALNLEKEALNLQPYK